MWLLVGLGNPGADYQHTRHNIGFMAVEAILHRFSFAAEKQKFRGMLSEGTIAGARVMTLRPLTYMNLSGESVGECVRFYKIPPEQIIVFHDELDLPLGKLRMKRGGGHGGHNGLKSLDAHIGQDYWRVRMGIDHPGDKDRVSDYVLSNFSKSEAAEVERITAALAEHAALALRGDDAAYMSKVALTLNPPPPKPPKAEKPAKAENASPSPASTPSSSSSSSST